MIIAILAPKQPFIDSDNKTTVAEVNRTSITLRGEQMVTSDTYTLAEVYLYPSYDPLPGGTFDAVFVHNASSDITVGNLSSGNSYALVLSSVIGTKTPCGDAILLSQRLEMHICTGKV